MKELVEDMKDELTADAGSQQEVQEVPDFSSFTKKDFVDALKGLMTESDQRKVDLMIRELRTHYNEMLQLERTEALRKFVEAGGVADDFQVRRDEWDAAFDVAYRQLRDKRLEQIKSAENKRAENYKQKTELLEELRKIVDHEGSFEKFKEVQNKWRSLGDVPAAHARTVWASYHALIDRYFDNRSIYFELKELDRKKNLEAKIELCVRAEKLTEVERINDAIRELNELHEEYKHIGPVAREEKDAVWERFKKASDAVYARRDAHVADVHEKLKKNLVVKEELIAAVTALSQFSSDRIKEWNAKSAEVLELQKKWEAAGPVPRSNTRDTNKKFWAAFKLFFQRKNQFFKKLDEERTGNLEKKRALVAQANALRDSEDFEKVAQELRNLQAAWKEIGPVPDKYREKIYEEFKAACDHFFERRRSVQGEADRQLDENLKAKEALCAQLESLIQQGGGSLEQLREIQKSWRAIGQVPRNATGIRNRFQKLGDQMLAGLSTVSDTDKDQFKLESELMEIKSDPMASKKIHAREQALRRQIAQAENDLAVLKNNLEFFARSKNADQLRADFNAKIEASAKEVDQLKKQLKQLRAAVLQ